MAFSMDDLEKLDMEQLIELKQMVEARVQQIAETEMQSLQAKMDRLKAVVSETKAGGKKTSGTKAPAKFRDPTTGKTWSGRGMTPVWLREYEEAGRSREEFAV